MHPAIPIVVISALIALFAGEDKPPTANETIILLPDQDGRSGALVIATPGAEVTLDHAYAGADIYPHGRIERIEADPATANARFSAALGARPPLPVSFTVYFVFGKDELTSDSIAQFNRIKAELSSRPAPEIVVIGHTDRVGALEYNDALSLKRAEMVRAALIAAGIAPAQIETSGRGEREPAVPTPDDVAEPRNRRVEIMVR
jgi:OOP family OmpA-OmpF porin